jgi:hypothetical protein
MAKKELRKGFGGDKDADWARRDPDLSLLRGDPEFERLYPESKPSEMPFCAVSDSR